MSNAPQQLGPPVRGSIRALGGSLVLHVILLILLAVFLRPAVSKGIADESGDGRAVDVLLKRQTSENEVEYFEDPSENTAEDAAADADTDQTEIEDALNEPSVEIPSASLPSAAPIQKQTLEAQTLTANGLARGSSISDNNEEFIRREQERIRKRYPTGPIGEVALFGGPATFGRSFVFVIDRSKSMGGKGINALDAASRELKRALSQLNDTHKFQVVVYHHERDLFNKSGLVPANAKNIAAMEEFFMRLPAFGGTNHGDAVMSGLRFRPDVLFLLTDAAEPPIKERALQAIRRRAGGRTSIHCIQFGSQPLTERIDYMERLAKDNNGTYSYVEIKP